jgi:hypothetical protein
MLGIENDYEKFCIDEAALYLYNQLTKGQGKPDKRNKKKLSGNEMLQSLATHKK